MNTEDHPTPETDSHETCTDCHAVMFQGKVTNSFVAADFARTLERQRDTALSDLHTLRKQADAMAEVLMPIMKAAQAVRDAHSEAIENGACDDLFVKTMESLPHMEATLNLTTTN